MAILHTNCTGSRFFGVFEIFPCSLFIIVIYITIGWNYPNHQIFSIEMTSTSSCKAAMKYMISVFSKLFTVWLITPIPCAPFLQYKLIIIICKFMRALEIHSYASKKWTSFNQWDTNWSSGIMITATNVGTDKFAPIKIGNLYVIVGSFEVLFKFFIWPIC